VEGRLNRVFIAIYTEGRCAWVVGIESVAAALVAGTSLGGYYDWLHWDALRFSPYCKFLV
jgi:hypothetical protein